jgi:hypothetical protein
MNLRITICHNKMEYATLTSTNRSYGTVQQNSLFSTDQMSLWDILVIRLKLYATHCRKPAWYR